MREAEVRQAVEALIAAAAHDEPTRVVPELALCQASARIDLASINGRLVGWEIKTRADTLARLPAQEAVYSRIFDRVWLVADVRHLKRATELVPSWWGILRIDEGPEGCCLRRVRNSTLNRHVDVHSLVRLLWRDEAFDELEALGRARGLERAPRRELWAALADAVPDAISKPRFQSAVRRRLMDRTMWRVDRPHKSDGDLL